MGKHPNAATALAAAQTEFPPITKTKTVEVRTKTGGTYTFDYATHDKIRASTIPVLAAHELALAQPLTNLNGQPAVKTILLHSSGDSIEETFPLPLRPDMTAQEVGSAITYIRRYAWVAMLGLVADDDDDGNHAAGNTVGTASDAAVSQADHQAPAAAAPSIPYVEKAQEAAQALRASQRPDVPRPTDRLTPKGDRILEAVTFVKRKPDKATKDGRTIYVFDVVLEGVAEEMTTMSERTRDDAVKNENSTARVEFVESGRFKNLWGVHPLETFSSADFPSDAESIPF